MSLKRLIHIDFHTLPNIYNFSEKFDCEQFADTLEKANVTGVNIVASCNIGFCYYPTQVGIRYPFMQGDLFGKTLAACHKRGIRVFAYVNVGLNHENAFLHEDWTIVNREGKRIYGDTTGNFFRRMCLNSSEYREYVLAIVKELSDNYEVDGMFFDGFKIVDCYCPKCLKDRIRLRIDEKDERAVLEFSYANMVSLCQELKALLPQKEVVFNGMPYAFDLSTHIEVECLPSGVWGYDYFNQAAAYARNFSKEIVYMTGRFQNDWGDFGGIKSKASFEYDFYDALSNGFAISFGDHRHPTENLNQSLYAIIGGIYQQAKKYEPFTLNAKYLAEIGVYNNKDIYDLENPKYIGAVRLLNELKYGYDLISAESDFLKYKVVIFPDDVIFDVTIGEKVSSYLQAGGKVIFSGFSGLNADKRGFQLSEENFLEYCGTDENDTPYFQFVRHENPLMKETRWSIYTSAIYMKNKSGEILGTFIKPYNRRMYDGRHGYFYTPPEKETEYSSVVISDNIARICFKIFTDYANISLNAHREIFKQILNRFIERPWIFAEEMPISSRLTLTKNEKNTLLHIRSSYPEWKNGKGVIEEHTVIQKGKRVRVQGRFDRAIDVITGKRLKLTRKKDYTQIILPEIVGYAMISLTDRQSKCILK